MVVVSTISYAMVGVFEKSKWNTCPLHGDIKEELVCSREVSQDSLPHVRRLGQHGLFFKGQVLMVVVSMDELVISKLRA